MNGAVQGKLGPVVFLTPADYLFGIFFGVIQSKSILEVHKFDAVKGGNLFGFLLRFCSALELSVSTDIAGLRRCGQVCGKRLSRLRIPGGRRFIASGGMTAAQKQQCRSKDPDQKSLHFVTSCENKPKINYTSHFSIFQGKKQNKNGFPAECAAKGMARKSLAILFFL